MNAYKCDICKNFFEDKKHNIGMQNPKKMCGHHTLELIFRRADSRPGVIMFSGDICPDCYGLLCEQMVARGCTDEYVKLDAEAHRNEASEALKTDAGKQIGYYDKLIEYLSQFDESDVVKVKYVRQKIEDAVGRNIDWYEKRRTHE